MNWFEALALAVIQGLTEFLPVSSSGHLVLAQTFFGIEPASAFSYDIVLHPGTAGVPIPLAAAGFVAAALTGYLAILQVLRWTRAGKLWQFDLHCWAVAGLAAAAPAKR